MKRVILILPFFGRNFPTYFRYWLKSVEGRDIDVLLVSDIDTSDIVVPPNVHLLRCSLGQLRKRAEEALNTVVALHDARKLCDLKPFYGKIFESEIEGYDYWAFGDADLVYGCGLDGIVKQIIDGGYDVWCNHGHWISGALCVFRNDARCRELCLMANNYQDILSNPDYLLFDELGCNDFDRLIKGEVSVANCSSKIDSFSAVVWRAEGLRFFHDDVICEDPLDDFIVIKDNDNLALKALSGERTVSIPLFHYINVKKHRGFKISGDVDLNSFIMTSTGMYPLTMSVFCRNVISLFRRLSGNVSYAKYRVLRFLRHRFRAMARRG